MGYFFINSFRIFARWVGFFVSLRREAKKLARLLYKLKRFLFEPFSEDVVDQMKLVIVESMNYWLPFVQITDIRVKMSDNESGDFRSMMEVSIDFNLSRDPTTTESVQVTIGE